MIDILPYIEKTKPLPISISEPVLSGLHLQPEIAVITNIDNES